MPIPIPSTPYSLLETLIGLEERPGPKDNHPLVQWGLELCGLGRNQPDEIAWCSAILQPIMHLLKLPRSKSAAARSWLKVGLEITIPEAKRGFDVVILKRGPEPQPGPEVTSGAPGHVGLFSGMEYGGATATRVRVLAGNQSDSINVQAFPLSQVLGVRRIG